MTFFMQRLAKELGAETPGEPPMPAMRPSTPTPVNEGGDRYVALRSLTEQLICEANAVIQDTSSHLHLTDEVGTDELVFTITCGGHGARVATKFRGDSATGQILSEDLPHEQPYELTDADAIPDLIVRLCLVAGLRNTESARLV
ncbi:MAG: hypothetical protein GXX86_10455 [Propionibacterium sp.]|nr:hypothetical protein [Propionibacterium sp.]